MSKSAHVINFSVLTVVILGVLKSILQDDALPSIRFFFGAGIMWLFLSGIGEFEEEIAKTLALVIATVVVLRDAGGVLNSFMGANSPTASGSNTLKQTQNIPTGILNPAVTVRRPAQTGTAVAAPGLFPEKTLPNVMAP